MRSRTVVALVFSLFAALIALAPAPAHAADPADEDAKVAQAKARFEEGRTAYLAGDYGKAIQAFQSAQDIRPSPILDYNIALCYEALGDAQSAVMGYRRYLALKPDASNRAEVEERIRSLEALQEQQAQQQEQQQAQPQPTQPSTGTQADKPASGADPYTQATPPAGNSQPPAQPAKPKTRWWIPVIIVGGAVVLTATIITVAVLASNGSTTPWVYETPSTHPLSVQSISQQPALLRF